MALCPRPLRLGSSESMQAHTRSRCRPKDTSTDWYIAAGMRRAALRLAVEYLVQ